MLIGLNIIFIGITAYYRPYLTDAEFLRIKNLGHEKANIQRTKKCSKEGFGVNNCLDLLFLIGETCLCISSLIAYNLELTMQSEMQEDLLLLASTNNTNTTLNGTTSVLIFQQQEALAAHIARKYPKESEIIAIFDSVGLIVFFSGFLYLFKYMFAFLCGKLIRKVRKRRIAGKPTEIVPSPSHTINKNNNISRRRSLTSTMFDKDLEASTIHKVMFNDEKRKALSRLERRKLLRKQGNTGNMEQNNSESEMIRKTNMKERKRRNSITSTMHIKHRAQEEILKNQINERRRSSKNRLLKRLTAHKKSKNRRQVESNSENGGKKDQNDTGHLKQEENFNFI